MTIADLIDRLFRDYLANPSDTPLQAKLQGSITDVATTLTYADELIPEEKAAIGVGAIIELGLELLRVTAHVESTRQLTVTRAMYGTTAAAHTATAIMRVAPKWPRVTVFEAVADEIVSLYPNLYAIGEEWADASELLVSLEDANAVEVQSALQLVAGHYENIPATLIRTQAVSNGVAVQFDSRFAHGDDSTIWIRYLKKFPRPTAESDTLADLGVDPSWVRIILIGTLGAMLPQSDIDAATQEFITEALENQGFRPTTATSLSVALGRMRGEMLRDARNRLRAQDNVRVHLNQVI